MSQASATLAQLVERHFCKVDVPGSSPGGGSMGSYGSSLTRLAVNQPALCLRGCKSLTAHQGANAIEAFA